jgi:transposase-like protein
MANKHRRNLDASFKTKVVLETLKGQKTVAQICSEFSIHPNQITQWKQQVLVGIPALFGQKSSPLSEEEQEMLTAPLFQQIGQLKVELDFLKKKLKQC